MRRLAVRGYALVPAVLLALGLMAVDDVRAAAPAPNGEGERVYTRWCVHCHAAGRGNPGTQSLQVKYGGKVPAVLLERTDLTAQAVAQFVRQGVQSMPPFRKTEVSDAELAALAAYVAKKR